MRNTRSTYGPSGGVGAVSVVDVGAIEVDVDAGSVDATVTGGAAGVVTDPSPQLVSTNATDAIATPIRLRSERVGPMVTHI